MLGADDVVNHIVGDLSWGLSVAAGLFLPASEVFGRQGGVVLAEGLELRGCPAPVLQHLTRCLDKVPHGVSAMETGVKSLGDEVVDAVTQFVEEGHHLVVLKQTGLLGSRLGEVAHQRGGWVATVAIGVDETLYMWSALANPIDTLSNAGGGVPAAR